MRSFKKFLFSVIAFALILSLTCSAISFPAFLNGSDYNDSQKRKELAGSIDYIFCGASHALAAFIPSIIDQELGINSYNLSSSSSYFHGREALIEKEIQRNHLNTVVIEISTDGLARDNNDDNSTGEPYIICKLDTFSEKMHYAFSHLSFLNNDFENVISILLRYGLKSWKAWLNGEFGKVQKNKGFIPNPISDISIPEDEIIRRYNQNTDDSYSFKDTNIESLIKIIDRCHENNVRVMVVVTPISDARIWKNKNINDFYQKLTALCSNNDCPVYDFNLAKERFSVFSDSHSFSNETHLSSDGAAAFSQAFSRFLNALNTGADTSALFYQSYDEMKEDSPYMQYYREHVND